MRKTAIGLLAMFRFAQVFMIVFGVLIISKAIEQATVWSIGVGAAFLVIGGVLFWMAQQMIEDVKRWDTSSPGEGD